MPQKLSQEVITAAIAGFEAQNERINSKIAEWRNMLDHRHAAEAPKRKRKISAASRRRMALAQKKRWATVKGRSWAISSAGSEPTEAANQRRGHETDIAATKRRWALKRAEEAKAKRAAAKKTRARNTALKAA